jgi:hypothetical protein
VKHKSEKKKLLREKKLFRTPPHSIMDENSTAPAYLAISTLGPIWRHARVRHIKANIQNGCLAVMARIVDHEPRLWQSVRQGFFPKHQLLILMITVQHSTEDIPADEVKKLLIKHGEKVLLSKQLIYANIIESNDGRIPS